MCAEFPKFRIAETVATDTVVKLIGTITATQWCGQRWIGERYYGYLKHGDFLAEGRWAALNDRWEFTLARPTDVEGLDGASEVDVLDGYWGERAALVLDSGATWGAETWPADEDHDHCAICWAKIWERENREHYSASDGVRVCPACYRSFVERRDLGFIVGKSEP